MLYVECSSAVSINARIGLGYLDWQRAATTAPAAAAAAPAPLYYNPGDEV